MIIADITLEDRIETRQRIRDILGDFDLDNYVLVSLSMACSAIYHKYADASGFYINVRKEGVELYAAA
jgi:hypothetical protein